MLIWDGFVSSHLIGTIGTPGLLEIACFMWNRVVSVIRGDPYAGKLKLQTFIGTELGLLLHGMRRRYPLFHLTRRNAVLSPRGTSPASAPPVWKRAAKRAASLEMEENRWPKRSMVVTEPAVVACTSPASALSILKRAAERTASSDVEEDRSPERSMLVTEPAVVARTSPSSAPPILKRAAERTASLDGHPTLSTIWFPMWL